MTQDQSKKNKLNWWHWVVLILLITLLILACVMVHYLWKLSDIWKAVKGSK